MCRLGALQLEKTLVALRHWLERNPREVVTIILQDEAPIGPTVRAFRDAGLVPLLAVPPANPDGAWPTLGKMISSGHRLVAFTENAHDAAPWLCNFYSYAQETPYSYQTVRDLESNRSCEPLRGGTGHHLFLLNHFVTVASGSRAASAAVNARRFLAERISRCTRLRGIEPTFVAVDFATLGQAQAVVDRMNRGG